MPILRIETAAVQHFSVGYIFSPLSRWRGVIRDAEGRVSWRCSHEHRTYGRAHGRDAALRCAEAELKRRAGELPSPKGRA